jgi:hypothetical protein
MHRWLWNLYSRKYIQKTLLSSLNIYSKKKRDTVTSHNNSTCVLRSNKHKWICWINCYKTTDRKRAASNETRSADELCCAQPSVLSRRMGQMRRATVLDTGPLRSVWFCSVQPSDQNKPRHNLQRSQFSQRKVSTSNSLLPTSLPPPPPPPPTYTRTQKNVSNSKVLGWNATLWRERITKV